MKSIIPTPAMKWRCLDCRREFYGPSGKAPDKGCIYCASRSVIDINTEPYGRPLFLRITNIRRK